PQTAQQYHVHYRKFAQDNLAGVFDPGDEHLRRFAEWAAMRAKAVAQSWGFADLDAVALSRLWLYDFVFLCDDSQSMRRHPERIDSLNDTLQRAANIATMLEPSGISVRFLNYLEDDDGDFDDLKNPKTILEKVKEAYKYKDGNMTRLGTVLDEKIVQPFVVEKIEEDEFEKPLMIFIITDGRPEGEDGDKLKDTILDCKAYLREQGIGSAAVTFVIAQVGNTKEGSEFLRELENDRDLRGMLYCSKGRLGDVRGFQSYSDPSRAWVC
ncbi:hypothetical protein BGZ60DRAFT_379157, partial [Tricladium varicosporioides]